ncbi:MAG TPA: hypothetical protein PLE28_01545 [bacterium]|nr:hypothetical protein [bacterium]
MKKKIDLFVVIILILFFSGLAFLGGYKYGKNKSVSNFSPKNEVRGDMPTGGRNEAPIGSKNASSSNQIIGSISAINDNNITVQTENGSSSIIYFSNNVFIGKMIEVKKEDLATGTAVLILGSSNSSSGTFIAESIQIK